MHHKIVLEHLSFSLCGNCSSFASACEMCDLAKKVFNFTDEDRDKIREMLGKTAESVKYDVSIIIDWIRKQAHLPQEIDEEFIERVLLRNKFQIERTKKKLDFYYTSKGIYADFFSRGDPTGIDITNVALTIQISPIPKLGPNMERITVINFTGNEHLTSMEMGTLLIFITFEIMQKLEYSSGDRLVVDLKNFNWQHYKTITPTVCARAANLFFQAYSTRIAGIDILNPPSFFELVMAIIKRYDRGKLVKKIKCHRNLDSLYESVPKQYLPKDFGGNMATMQELYGNTLQLLITNRDFILKALRNKSKEDLRIGAIKYNEFFGVDGTFRNLEVD